MINYIKKRIKRWKDKRAFADAKRTAHDLSEQYNNKQVIVYNDPGTRIIRNNGETLLLPMENGYLFMNRKGFLLARRRRMFDKSRTWTQAVNACRYSTYK